jgi:hypothetical protein
MFTKIYFRRKVARASFSYEGVQGAISFSQASPFHPGKKISPFESIFMMTSHLLLHCTSLLIHSLMNSRSLINMNTCSYAFLSVVIFSNVYYCRLLTEQQLHKHSNKYFGDIIFTLTFYISFNALSFEFKVNKSISY